MRTRMRGRGGEDEEDVGPERRSRPSVFSGEALATPHSPHVQTSQGGFAIWLPLTALGILQTSHAAISKCKAKDHVPKLNRGAVCIPSHDPIPVPIFPPKTTQADCEPTCTTNFASTKVDPE